MFTMKMYAHMDIFKVILNSHECHPTINMSECTLAAWQMKIRVLNVFSLYYPIITK